MLERFLVHGNRPEEESVVSLKKEYRIICNHLEH